MADLLIRLDSVGASPSRRSGSGFCSSSFSTASSDGSARGRAHRADPAPPPFVTGFYLLDALLAGNWAAFATQRSS